jgi:hypothetical protein
MSSILCDGKYTAVEQLGQRGQARFLLCGNVQQADFLS